MIFINRKSKEVALNSGRSKTRMYATVDNRKIYFTAMVTVVCEMAEGLYVHFINEGSDWKFIVNDDSDGFKLTPVRAKNGFHITNTGLVAMILKSIGHKHPKKFHIDKTTAVHDKCPIFSFTP